MPMCCIQRFLERNASFTSKGKGVGPLCYDFVSREKATLDFDVGGTA